MSGRSIQGGTPVTRVISNTRVGGGFFHCETACEVTPIAAASFPTEPAFRIASWRAADFMASM